jgi:hypothetical protein
MLLVVAGGADIGAPLLALAMALGGIGLGAFESPNVAGALAAAGEAHLSVGTAMINVLGNLGMTLGVGVASMLLENGHRDGASGATWEGVRGALLVGAATAGLGAIASAIRPGGRLTISSAASRSGR